MKSILSALAIAAVSAAPVFAAGLGDVRPEQRPTTIDLVTQCEIFLVPGTNYYNYVDPTCPRGHPIMEDHDEDEPVETRCDKCESEEPYDDRDDVE